jgi:hypothetical protein
MSSEANRIVQKLWSYYTVLLGKPQRNAHHPAP